MDDLNRLIAKKEREKPGFAAAVEKRKGELLIAARLREAREKLKRNLETSDTISKFEIVLQKCVLHERDSCTSKPILSEYASLLRPKKSRIGASGRFSRASI